MNNLHTKFFQFSVQISGKSFIKKAQAVKDSASVEFDCAKDKITASKKLANCRETKDLTNISQKIRKFIESNTLKLGRYSVISPSRYFKVKMDFNLLVDEYRTVRAAFLSAWDDIILADQKMITGLGNLFNISDYPSIAELEDSFGVTWRIEPLPDFSNCQVDGLNSTEVAEMVSILGNEIDSDIKEMSGDMLGKLLYGKDKNCNEGKGNGLIFAISRLRQVDSEKKSFKVNTLENVAEVAGIVSDLNAIGNPDIDRLAGELIEHFGKADADILREDGNAREVFIQKASETLEEIQNSMADFA